MPAPWVVPLVSGAASAIGSIWSARSAKKEAARNRQFQERMSSTAHQRAMEDMRKAGINPMLAAGAPASTPAGAQADVSDIGEAVPRGVSSALGVKMAQSQIGLIDAQADQASSGAELARAQSKDIGDTLSSRLTLAQAQRELAYASANEKRNLLPFLLERAKEEIAATSASAQRTRMLTRLDELREEGFRNIEAFEREIGEWGPWARLFFEAARSIRQAPTGGRR